MIEFGIAVDLGSASESVASRLARTQQLASLAEAAGLTSIWFGEGYAEREMWFHLPSSLLMLAAIADRTRLRLGAGVALLPAWNPLRLAYDAALLDQISGGRLLLGLGIGTPALWRRFGVPTERMGDRVDEVLQALKALWRGEDGFRGELVQVSGGVYPPPVSPGGPPLWIGGRVRRSVRRAARFGDGWYAATSYRLGEIRRLATDYREECAQAGRQPGPVVVNRIVVLAADGAQARSGSRGFVEALIERYVRIRSIVDEDGAPLSFEEALARRDEVVLVGSPAEVRERLHEYADAGVTHIQARIWPNDLPIASVERTIELLGREVVGRV